MNDEDKSRGAVMWLAVTLVIAGLAFWFGHSAGMSEATRFQMQNAAYIQRQRDAHEEAEQAATQPTATELEDPATPTD